MRSPRLPVCLPASFGMFVLAAGALPAQQPAATAPLQAFLHKSTAEQTRIHDELRSILDGVGAPHGQALRALADAARTPHAERTPPLAARHGKKVMAADAAGDAVMPLCVHYVFGIGAIEALEAKAAAGPKPDKGDKTAPKPAHLPVTHAQRAAAVEQALRGIAPGADFALAELQARLDTDFRGDAFAAFLHSWRNGAESFYEALDRTAGTKDSVFFYDAMLGDFRTEFAAADTAGSGRLAKGLQAAHDALHDAFLCYRQYRGFREAVAWSLVLPPDVPLPKRLARYEARSAAGYSLRQQVTMVQALLGDDPREVAAEIVRKSPPLPQPLWGAGYDPYAAWNEQFAALVPKMIERAASTDAFLAAAEQARRDAAAGIAAAAQKAIDPDAGKPRR